MVKVMPMTIMFQMDTLKRLNILENFKEEMLILKLTIWEVMIILISTRVIIKVKRKIKEFLVTP